MFSFDKVFYVVGKILSEEPACTGTVLVVLFYSYLQLVVTFPYYGKNSKIWDTSNNCHNFPKKRKV